jgi:cell division protein FtsL
MEQTLSKIKSWWFLIFFIGTLIVTWTNFSNRLLAMEKIQQEIVNTQKQRNIEYTLLQIDIASIKTSLEFIRERIK